jgi:hypothetical protein
LMRMDICTSVMEDREYLRFAMDRKARHPGYRPVYDPVLDARRMRGRQGARIVETS